MKKESHVPRNKFNNNMNHPIMLRNNLMKDIFIWVMMCKSNNTGCFISDVTTLEANNSFIFHFYKPKRCQNSLHLQHRDGIIWFWNNEEGKTLKYLPTSAYKVSKIIWWSCFRIHSLSRVPPCWVDSTLHTPILSHTSTLTFRQRLEILITTRFPASSWWHSSMFLCHQQQYCSAP